LFIYDKINLEFREKKMKRIKLVIQFLGQNYSGWQIQPNTTTVQGELNRAIAQITGEDVEIFGCSRTDAGVSAMGLVAHFDTNSRIEPRSFFKAINTKLPNDIRVLDSSEVASDFHARFDVKSKTYEYNFYVSPIRLPYIDSTSTRINPPFDFELAKQGVSTFLGRHDFSAFCSAGNSSSTTIRTIFDVKLVRTEFGYRLIITGDGFLYNMVRIIAGTLIEVGRGKILPTTLPQILASRDRTLAGATAEPRGLVLKSVEY